MPLTCADRCERRCRRSLPKMQVRPRFELGQKWQEERLDGPRTEHVRDHAAQRRWQQGDALAPTPGEAEGEERQGRQPRSTRAHSQAIARFKQAGLHLLVTHTALVLASYCRTLCVVRVWGDERVRWKSDIVFSDVSVASI